jgi:CBS domain-containing protein
MAEDRPISEFMTTAIHTIDLESSLQRAHFVMEKHDIRHLPVLDDGKFVGVLSQRELELLRAFPILDLAVAAVPDAMTNEPYVVAPETPLGEVVGTMAAHKFGSAVVADGGELKGIFTTTDALRLISALIA